MKVFLTQGTAYKIVNGERVSVSEIEAQSPSPCECRLDCYTGGLYLKDIATKQLNVLWIENGAVVTGTVEDFNTARSAY